MNLFFIVLAVVLLLIARPVIKLLYLEVQLKTERVKRVKLETGELVDKDVC